MKIAVIGGVAAGTSAAARAKRKMPEAEITIFEQDTDISYSGCGLPYYISDLIEDREDVIIYTPQRFAEKKEVVVKSQHQVQEIKPQAKKIIVKDLKNDKIQEVDYDKLLISTGASPIEPPIDGSELENIFTLRNVNSADKIKDFIATNNPQQAVVIGGGYIGLEMAENLLESNIDVTVVEQAKQILTNFDEDMANIVEDHLVDKGVDVVTNDGVEKFVGEETVEKVITASGEEIETDFVLLSIGVKPNVELAQEAGIELGETGAIKVNSKLETSAPDVYAAGDCVETKHMITDEAVWIPLGSTANKQGRVAGSNLANLDDEFKGVLGTAISKVCDLGVARTGLTVKEAEDAGYQVVSSQIKTRNHAGYYPNAKILTIKLVVEEETGLILGAQVIGEEDADKKIDVLATAIYNEMKADELIELDLSYAPPFSIPKDGLMVAGIVADKKRQ
ncbi:FAD-dependent oxidoreductase [Halanaerobacter jeridensis]|uniref:NADPH-dependent 2,4-dienoyl-CoA reductase/sulfur reductase-like enzyme n=1 Tax=Halanaerobacter jeridensis TaxID=706427 RepID=A0A939BMI9_9FIRM|nr:FAD-dependent oxidoreductase [Halanaerobacter jeridensis]MBM7556640.1 NADPH-dependent 2,4-dienoyl-CoA reductase/sulfur reductase-like enzyme [Halanaerobacter jeridensis]